MQEMISTRDIEQRIFLIRGQKVMIDRDLAGLYEVPTFALNQAVRRNIERFPDGFMFRLTREETNELITNCDRLY
ncbi:MAG: ORF6N domain-containing protein [Elusimicrobia bacterium]|nr:ORF6N domain-containing protein [Elusimicrobiota bacterium]